MDIKKLIDVILTSLNDGKATNIDVYDIKKMSTDVQIQHLIITILKQTLTMVVAITTET